MSLKSGRADSPNPVIQAAAVHAVNSSAEAASSSSARHGDGLQSRPKSPASSKEDVIRPAPLQPGSHPALQRNALELRDIHSRTESSVEAATPALDECGLSAKFLDEEARLIDVIDRLSVQKNWTTRLRNPGYASMLANMAGQGAANLWNFALPTFLTACIKEIHPDMTSEQRAATFSLLIGAFNVVGQDIQPFVTRVLGGSTTNYRLSGNHSSNHGVYQDLGMGLMQTTFQLGLYLAPHALMSASQPLLFSGPAGGILEKSLVGMLAMVSVGQVTNTLATKLTLGDKRARQLDEPSGNRRFPNGATQSNLQKWSERTTFEHKALEVAAKSTAIAIASGFLYLMTSFAEATHSNAKTGQPTPDHTPGIESFLTIGPGFFAMFAAIAAVQALWTYFHFDSRIHVQRAGLASQGALGKQVLAMPMNVMTTVLNKATIDLSKGRRPGEQGLVLDAAHGDEGTRIDGIDSKHLYPAGIDEQRQLYLTSFEVLSGAALQPEGPRAGAVVLSDEERQSRLDARLVQATDLKTFFDKIGLELRALPKEGAAHAGTLSKLADIVEDASELLKEITKNASSKSPLNPEFDGINLQVRRMQALLVKSVFRLDAAHGTDAAYLDVPLMKAAAELFPVFAALRQCDRTATVASFMGGLVDAFQGRNKSGALKALTAHGLGRLLVTDITDHLIRLGQDPLYVVKMLGNRLEQDFGAKTPDELNSKLLILKHGLAAIDRQIGIHAPLVAPSDTGLPAVMNLFNSLNANASRAAEKGARQQFVKAFLGGGFMLEELGEQLSQWNREASKSVSGRQPAHRRFWPAAWASEPDNAIDEVAASDRDIEAAPDADQEASARSLRCFTQVMGQKFVDAVLEEIRPDQGSGLVFHEQLLKAVQRDIEGYPESRRVPLKGALTELPNLPILTGIPMTEFNDIHNHYNTYAGSYNSTSLLAQHFAANGVKSIVFSPLPSQVYGVFWNGKYYTNTKAKMSYMQNDNTLAAQEIERQTKKMAAMALLAQMKDHALASGLEAPEPKLVEISATVRNAMTGFDPTDKPSIIRTIRDNIRNYAGVDFVMAGESTLYKEGVVHVNPREFNIDSDASRELLYQCALAGIPILIHSDAGTPLSKLKLVDDLRKVMRETAERLTMPAADTLRSQRGKEHVPNAKLVVIHAHLGGGSRFTHFDNEHVRTVHATLNDPAINNEYCSYNIDNSWDWPTHDVMRNTCELFENIPNASDTVKAHMHGLVKAMQPIMKSYMAFTELGSGGDHVGDASNPNASALVVAAADPIVPLHLKTIANFKVRVVAAMAVKEVRDAMISLFENDSATGNNFLWLLFMNFKKVFAGTDTLAPGAKAHGAGSFIINARMWEFFNVVVQELAAYDPVRFGEISRAINVLNFEELLNNQLRNERKRENEANIRSMRPFEWSAPPLVEKVFEPAIAPLPGSKVPGYIPSVSGSGEGAAGNSVQGSEIQSSVGAEMRLPEGVFMLSPSSVKTSSPIPVPVATAGSSEINSINLGNSQSSGARFGPGSSTDGTKTEGLRQRRQSF